MTQTLRRSWLPLVLVLSSLPLTAQQSSAPKESDFLSRIRRLTVEGRRAGEGYWGPDGQRLVFQSEREPGNPFYQIYLMDMASARRLARSSTHKPAMCCLRQRTTIRARNSSRTTS